MPSLNDLLSDISPSRSDLPQFVVPPPSAVEEVYDEFDDPEIRASLEALTEGPTPMKDNKLSRSEKIKQVAKIYDGAFQTMLSGLEKVFSKKLTPEDLADLTNIVTQNVYFKAQGFKLALVDGNVIDDNLLKIRDLNVFFKDPKAADKVLTYLRVAPMVFKGTFSNTMVAKLNGLVFHFHVTDIGYPDIKLENYDNGLSIDENYYDPFTGKVYLTKLMETESIDLRKIKNFNTSTLIEVLNLMNKGFICNTTSVLNKMETFLRSIRDDERDAVLARHNITPEADEEAQLHSRPRSRNSLLSPLGTSNRLA